MTTTYVSDTLRLLAMSGIKTRDEYDWLRDISQTLWITELECSIIGELIHEYVQALQPNG